MTADIDVEALVLGPVSLVAEVPLAGKESLVVMTLQFLGNGHFLMGQIVAVLGMKKFISVVIGLPGYPVGDVDANGMSSGHDAGPGGRAYRTSRITIGELHPGGSQLVDVRRFVKGAAIGPYVRPSHVVYEKEDEVRGFLRCKSGEAHG